jgi:hypothetical protein
LPLCRPRVFYWSAPSWPNNSRRGQAVSRSSLQAQNSPIPDSPSALRFTAGAAGLLNLAGPASGPGSGPLNRAEPNRALRVLVPKRHLSRRTDVSVGGLIEAVLTPAMFRNRASDCQSLAERAPNQRVRDILLDMSRTWTRLALEAEEWRRDNSSRSRLAKKGATKDRPKIIAPNPLPLPASPREPGDS